MVDFLEELCVRKGIKLVYTNNKITILSSSYQGGFQIIRVHRMFKGCPEELANAIVGYYTDSNNKNSNLRVIEDYIKENFNSLKYTIALPMGNNEYELIHAAPVVKAIEQDNKLYKEMNIKIMTKKTFWGEEKQIKPDEGLSVPQEDVLEVEIFIDPFST